MPDFSGSVNIVLAWILPLLFFLAILLHMSLSIEEVKKIAELARLELTPDEEKRYAETISAVLEYMTILNEVDTTGVPITSQVTGLEGVVRDDVVVDCPPETRKKLLSVMPQVEMDELVVPGVFSEE